MFELNRQRIGKLSHQQVCDAIKHVVCSVDFEVDIQLAEFRVTGPDTSYYLADPDLNEIFSLYDKINTLQDVTQFRENNRYFSLCFDDTWSGYCVADYYLKSECKEDVVFIHLDDHTDMMPTLLTIRGEKILNSASDTDFNAMVADDWIKAIDTGIISIGNFITPLFYLPTQLHVRHLCDRLIDNGCLQFVSQEALDYELIPNHNFAGISKHPIETSNHHGTYKCSTSISDLLANLPTGKLIVHIDLDYFVNDYNGNHGQERTLSEEDARTVVESKMDDFFDHLFRIDRPVEKWIVATSPGFCSVNNWGWLLDMLTARIASTKQFFDFTY